MFSPNALNIRIANLVYRQYDICLSLDYTEDVLQYLR